MKRLWVWIALLSVITSAQLTVRLSAETLRIGVESINFHPHYWFDRNQQMQGFTADLLSEFSNNSEYQIELVPMAPSELLSALLEGKIDAKYPDNPLWATDVRAGTTFHYSEPVAKVVEGTLVNPRRLTQELQDVKTLGTVAGFTPWLYSDLINSGAITVNEYPSLKALIRAAIKNEVDAVFFNVVVATYFVDNLSTLPFLLEFNPNLPYDESTFHLTSIKKPEAIKAFDQFLKNQSQSIQALKDKYNLEVDLSDENLGKPSWQQTSDGD